MADKQGPSLRRRRIRYAAVHKETGEYLCMYDIDVIFDRLSTLVTCIGERRLGLSNPDLALREFKPGGELEDYKIIKEIIETLPLDDKEQAELAAMLAEAEAREAGDLSKHEDNA